MKTAHKTLAAIFAILAIALFAACSDSENIITSVDLNGTTYSASIELEGIDYTEVVTLEFTSSYEVTLKLESESKEWSDDEKEYPGRQLHYTTAGSNVYIGSEDDDFITLIAFPIQLPIELTNSSGQLSWTYTIPQFENEISLTFTKS